MPIAEGAVFAGYTIQRLLGSGGMGEVYLVQHPRLPRQEALKILPASVSADPDYRQRFAREADIVASLWHPHIVAVHDRGEYDGQLWIAMDYVEGTDASRLLRERYPHGLPPTDVIDIVTAVADALDYAHERFLLHRDVKPANILLGDLRHDERRIVLADFGIARGVDDSNGLTATNMTVGSVAYAAPEQLTGKVLDGRADQYALAATAFHLLTGSVPFGNSNPAVVIGNHLSSPPPVLSTLRDDLGRMDSALATAMAKEPHHRFQTCREFAAALAGRAAVTPVSGAAPAVSPSAATQLAPRTEPVMPESAPPQRAPAPPPETDRPRQRTGLIVAATAAALVAVGLVAFIGAKLAQSPADPSASTPSPSLLPPAWSETIDPPRTVTETAPPVTITQPNNPAPAPPPPRPPASPRTATGGGGDLGLAQPMSRPSCKGQGIVVLGSVTTPGQYAAGVQRLLAAFPGASYLRTDQTCPSLRAATASGNPIYAVYRPAGNTTAEVCSSVRAAGGDSYGKWLDYTTEPSYRIPC